VVTPGLKNMKNFDMKRCAQYENIQKDIKNISQEHKKPNNISPHQSIYILHIDNGNLELTYEFN